MEHTAKEGSKTVQSVHLDMHVLPKQMTFEYSAQQATTHSVWLRLVNHVQLVPSAQTLRAHPLTAQMGLTAWDMQPVAQHAQLDITVMSAGKMQCHCLVILVPTATYQPLSALTVKQAMPVKDLTHLQHHHQGYVHWVSIVLMACKR